MRKFVLLFLSILLLTSGAYAQNRPVSGTVTDGSGSTVAGVTVVLQNSMIAGVTNVAGNYSLNVPSDGILEFIHIGMETQVVSIAGRTRIDVVMKTDDNIIDDVIVTGYGVVRRSAFTGSASVVGESVINSKTDANFLKSLDGAVAGLKMSSRSGIPGGYTEIIIRGVGSVNSGREPLYVVDGMPIWADKQSLNSTSMIYFSPLANINPNDIESLSVLKDATATALYGARAANGVIVITTKKGSGDRLNVNFDMKFGVNQIAPYTDKYKLVGAKKYFDIYRKSLEEMGEIFDDHFDPALDNGTDTDWMKEITRNGVVQDLNLSISGSSSDVTYFSSLGYMKNEGFVIGTGTERFSGRLNLEAKSNIFTYGINTSFSQSIFHGSPTNSSYTNAIVAVSLIRPYLPVYNPDGSYLLNDAGLAAGHNPVAINDPDEGNINKQTHTTLNANPYLSVNLGYGISAKSSLGFSLYDYKEYSYWSSTLSPQGRDYNGLGQQYNTLRTNIVWTNTLSWLYTFNAAHNVSLLLGQEMQRQKLFDELYRATNYALGFRDMAAASKELGAGMNANEYARMASYFMNAEYDYDHRYYISGSFRRDGSSSFGRNNRWGDFWSVGAKWRLSEESFLKGNKTVSNLSLRTSYGTVGNSDIGWYSSRGFYELGPSFNYDKESGMVRTSVSNPNLGWEQRNKFNVGFDLGLLKGKINITVDFYNEVTKNMIFKVPISMTTGLANTYKNIGSMKNTGLELGFTATLLQKKDLHWTLYANATFNKNEVIALSTDVPITGSITRVEVGKPFYQFYMKEYAGVDSYNGNPLWWAEQEVDGVMQDYLTDSWNLANKRSVGSADPKVYGGFGTSFAFKGFDFSMNFSYQMGGKVYNSGNSHNLQTGHNFKGPVANYVYDNAWTPENKNTDVPKFVPGSRRGENQHSTRFLYSSNFLRMKTIALGYTIPANWTKKAFMQKVRIYATIDNLFTIKHKDFIGFDPESSPNGVQEWSYPVARTFSGGLSIGF